MREVIEILVLSDDINKVKELREYVINKFDKSKIIVGNPYQIFVTSTPRDSRFLGKGLLIRFRSARPECCRGFKPDILVTTDIMAEAYFGMYCSEIYKKLEDIL